MRVLCFPPKLFSARFFFYGFFFFFSASCPTWIALDPPCPRSAAWSSFRARSPPGGRRSPRRPWDRRPERSDPRWTCGSDTTSPPWSPRWRSAGTGRARWPPCLRPSSCLSLPFTIGVCGAVGAAQVSESRRKEGKDDRKHTPIKTCREINGNITNKRRPSRTAFLPPYIAHFFHSFITTNLTFLVPPPSSPHFVHSLVPAYLSAVFHFLVLPFPFLVSFLSSI